MEQKVSKKGTPPPRYDEAFKAGAVRMVTEQGRDPKEVARDLGICIDTEPFPGKRTRKYPKNRNESLIFCGMLVHAA